MERLGLNGLDAQRKRGKLKLTPSSSPKIKRSMPYSVGGAGVGEVLGSGLGDESELGLALSAGRGDSGLELAPSGAGVGLGDAFSAEGDGDEVGGSGAALHSESGRLTALLKSGDTNKTDNSGVPEVAGSA
jgi:hypothetical protein